MHSLMWKFWLTNWMVSLLMSLAMVAVFVFWWRFQDYQAASIRPDRVIHEMSQDISQVIDSETELRAFLVDNQASDFGTLYMVDMQGRDLLGRQLPASLLDSPRTVMDQPPRMPTIPIRKIVKPAARSAEVRAYK